MTEKKKKDREPKAEKVEKDEKDVKKEEEIEEPIVIPADDTPETEEVEVKDLAAEYKDMLQRLQAEFDNYRKRNIESVKNARNDGVNEMILELLPVMDSFERGLNTLEESAKAGMELICKQMKNLFAKYEVKEIEALDKPFDPNVHHAIAQCDDPEKAGMVVEVFQKGYIRKNKVLRASLVKVAQ